jgi:hypothetical protein
MKKIFTIPIIIISLLLTSCSTLITEPSQNKEINTITEIQSVLDNSIQKALKTGVTETSTNKEYRTVRAYNPKTGQSILIPPNGETPIYTECQGESILLNLMPYIITLEINSNTIKTLENNITIYTLTPKNNPLFSEGKEYPPSFIKIENGLITEYSIYMDDLTETMIVNYSISEDILSQYEKATLTVVK